MNWGGPDPPSSTPWGTWRGALVSLCGSREAVKILLPGHDRVALTLVERVNSLEALRTQAAEWTGDCAGTPVPPGVSLVSTVSST